MTRFNEVQKAMLLKEIDLLKLMDHPNIIRVCVVVSARCHCHCQFHMPHHRHWPLGTCDLLLLRLLIGTATATALYTAQHHRGMTTSAHIQARRKYHNVCSCPLQTRCDIMTCALVTCRHAVTIITCHLVPSGTKCFRTHTSFTL